MNYVLESNGPRIESASTCFSPDLEVKDGRRAAAALERRLKESPATPEAAEARRLLAPDQLR